MHQCITHTILAPPKRLKVFTAFLQDFDPARLEVHDPAALVACCQQLVECSVGIRPEVWGPGAEKHKDICGEFCGMAVS